MKKYFSLSILFLAISLQGMAQVKKLVATPNLDFTYYVQGEGGRSGLTVVYNPDAGLYYAIQGGNANFPLEVFRGNGELYFATTAKVDCRGFWYNTKDKCFEGTMYQGGRFRMYLNNKNEPSTVSFPGAKAAYAAPTENTQTTCNPAKKEMYAYYKQEIYVYNHTTNLLKKRIQLKNAPVNWQYINELAMVFTGYKGYEFGVYDYINAKMYFFNASGSYTGVIQLPFDTPKADILQLGFANDRLFVYDTDYRYWNAYKIFE